MLDKTNILTKEDQNVKVKIEFMNWIKKILTKIFLKPKEIDKELITAKNCDILDDVWVQENEKIYSGFIYSKTRRRILISYCTNDNQFHDEYFMITNLSDDTKIQKNNLTLYFNKPCFTD